MTAKKLNLVLLGFIGLIVLATAGGYYLLSTRLGSVIDQVTTKEEDILLASEEIDNLKILQGELSRIEEIKPIIDEALPKSKDASAAIAQIQTMANRNGIRIISINFEATKGLPSESSQTRPSTVVPTVSTVPVTLETELIPYESLKQFLRDLLAIRRNANVSELLITRDATATGRVKAQIVVDLHVEKAPSTETKENSKKAE